MKGPEIVGAVADLAGFIGAFLLAIPFFVGQAPRDTVLIALARPGEIPLSPRHIQHIARYWYLELWCARVGIVLIGLAFATKLGVSIYELLNRLNC
jgi:hypothetical protein